MTPQEEVPKEPELRPQPHDAETLGSGTTASFCWHEFGPASSAGT